MRTDVNGPVQDNESVLEEANGVVQERRRAGVRNAPRTRAVILQEKRFRIAALIVLAALVTVVSGLGVSHLRGAGASQNAVEASNAAENTDEPKTPDAEESTGAPESAATTDAPESVANVDAADVVADTDGPEVVIVSAAGSTDGAKSNDPWFSRLWNTRTKAEKTLEGMSTRDKAFQLFIVFADQLTDGKAVTSAGDDVRDGLDRYPVGGVIFDRSNMESREQLRNLLDNMQAFSRVPMIMTCDEEGGRVNRLMGAVGTTYVGPMLSYREQGAATAKNNALTIAGGLTSCGFNMDLAPVADVWSNPENTVIGNRAYSTDFQQAAELVQAAVEGFHEGGVACTLKHFPGHGDTYEDSHNGLARVYRTREQLEASELRPFRAGIAAGADAVMVGHLIVGEIDSEPATVSHVIVTDILRDELGFDGVIMTDSLQMDAITKTYGAGEAAVRALEAGVDVLLCPDDLGAAADAVLAAVDSGRLTEARLDESVLRVLQLKERYGVLQ